jgi:hypothetical protein
MRVFSWDIETYPDLFTIAATNCYDMSERYVLSLENTNDRNENAKKLADFVNGVNADTMVGYNSLGFDLPVCIYALLNGAIPKDIERFASMCIRKKKEDWERKEYNKYRYYRGATCFSGRTQLDLILHFNTIDRVSLKALLISIGWHNIIDLPYPPGSQVLPYIEEIKEYNLNDTDGTAAVYIEMYDEIKLRYDTGAHYKIDVLNTSRSVMGAKLMGHLYKQAYPNESYDLENQRTFRNELHFADVVNEKIEFKTQPMQRLLNDIKGISYYGHGEHVDNSLVKWNREVTIGQQSYTMGVGGIHSIHEPEYFETKDGYTLVDADVESYYPRLMINDKVSPKHLGAKFLELYERLVELRIAAKKAGIKITAYALKITINAIFGKMGSSKEWFYDLLALYQVTLNGQLYLFMLIEELNLQGFDTFYANTDGITCRIKDSRKDEFYAICEAWEKQLNFKLEYVEIEKIMMRDVNNYTLRDVNGNYKDKGAFIPEPRFGKPVNAPIIAQAIRAWFYEGTVLEKTIASSLNLRDYEMTKKVGPQFDAELHWVNKGTPQFDKLQRVNRYYAAKGTGAGSLYKRRKRDGGCENLLKDSLVGICNNYADTSRPVINLDYYTKRARKAIAEFDPPNQKLLF